MDEKPSCPVAAGYAELLAREPWHWFCTLTFSPTRKVRDKWTGELRSIDRFHPIHGMHLEAADKAFKYFVRCLNEQIYGNNWRRAHKGGGVIWARGQEFHKSGRVHFHSVMAAPNLDLNTAASRYYWHEWWYREFGRNQIERPRDQDEVTEYVSKYVSKEGEVDFSANFGTAKPPEIFSVVEHRKAGNRTKLPDPAADHVSQQGQTKGSQPAFLSLTLPVRPQQTQQIFTDETFFHLHPQPEEMTCASASTTPT